MHSSIDRQRVLRGIEWAIGGVLVLVLIGYSGFTAKRIFEGPKIVIEVPADGATISTSLIEVRGTTKNALSLTLDGRLIAIDTTGRFDEQLLLSYGYNIIELVATDRAGKSIKKTVTLFYQ
jgi:hypothetical protein